MSLLTSIGLVALVALVRCSSSTPSPELEPPVDPAYTPIVPPDAPKTSATGGEVRWYAVKASFLGNTNRQTGAPQLDAWSTYGFDLDGRDTTAQASVTNFNTCKKRDGALSHFLQDGDGGIDNNFGQQVMPVVRNFKTDVDAFVNDGLANGTYALLLKLENVGPADNAHVPGSLYLTTAFNDGKSKPTFTTSDHWPVSPISLKDGKTITQPKVYFASGYMAGGVWVSGGLGGGALDLGLLLGGIDGELPIESPTIAIKLDSTEQGTIAGAISTNALEVGLTPVAKRLGICPGGTIYNNVVSTLSLAADLVSGAPQLQDTSKTCDAVSIGIGFALSRTGESTVVGPAAAPPAPDKCTDAGP